MANGMTRHEEDGALIPEVIEGANALEAQVRAETDIQIATAKRYPLHSTAQGIERAVNQAIALATGDQDTAAACLYAVPREGKMIEGRSVRLAEIMAASWGNLRICSRVIGADQTHITVEGLAHDLENNVAYSAQVKRRITRKDGRRYSDDMITVTANAASSIAIRNAIFKAVPAAIADRVYKAARQMATGGKMAIETRRAKALQRFALIGATEDRIVARLGRHSLAEIDEDDLATLIGLWNAVQANEVSVDEAFPPVAPEDGKGAAAVAAKVKAKRADTPKDQPAPEPQEGPATVETPAPTCQGKAEAETPPYGDETPEECAAAVKVLWPKLRPKGVSQEEVGKAVRAAGWQAAAAGYGIDPASIASQVIDLAEVEG